MIRMFIFLKKFKRYFTPKYIYTLDRSYNRSSNGNWLFKAYGSHTYVKKNWEQIASGNFLNSVNPHDIAFIAEFEAKEKIASIKLNVSEENKNGIVTFVNKNEKIKIKVCDFLMSKELIENTSSTDVAKIAYREGVKKGREISACIYEKEKNKHAKNNILKLIK